ncbi:uncharacterized protein LY89DRAFT_735363 [Mollisia scopiformis]|uniref:Uncharacterized protein n=1 Tax=Mollisia scopiformis TaxID=149040 RepID=A0A194X601_MOLSC|nr:uncharacterized protein LY89DRAFT_735363 [Mollisia scopiformis]KUJ15232.1 hypothetical protein LY89DRAFT_735363 [Mollisia scopiformis]
MVAGIEAETSSMHTIPIILDRMPQQQKAKTQNDDWTGQSNQAERRRRQNRLNQRAYSESDLMFGVSPRTDQGIAGKRKEAESQQVPPIEHVKGCAWHVAHNEVNSTPGKEISKLRQYPVNYDPLTGPWQSFSAAIMSAEPQIWALAQVALHLKDDYEKSDRSINQFRKWVERDHLTSSPTSDHVLTLIKFNVFRALVHNAITLNLSVESTLEDNALSPFASKSKSENPFMPLLPAVLQPTLIQRQIPHHPWLDLLPVPRMRDNIILAGEDYDGFDLCKDLCGLFN